MNKTYVLLILLIAAFSTFAQTNRIPGYIVTIKKDTIRGFVIDRNDNWAIRSIEFSDSPDGDIKLFKVKDITAVYMEKYKALYVVRQVKFDLKPTDMGRLQDNPIRYFAEGKVLVRVLVSGELSLYNYIDENKKGHFFLEKAGKVEELEFVRYRDDIKLIELPFYKGQLRQLAFACGKVNPYIPFTSNALTKFVRQYNECFGGSKESGRVKKAKSKVLFGAFAGLQTTSTSYRDKTTQLNAADSRNSYKMGTGGFVGLNIELRPPSASNKSRFGLQIAFQKFGEGQYSYVGANATYTDKYDFSTLRIGPTYKYIFKATNKVAPYIKAEMQMLFLKNSTATRTSVDVFGVKKTEQFATVNNNGLSTGAAIGIALVQHINIEVRYNLNLISSNSSGFMAINSLELGLGFMFNK